jgi:hypothetical protein
MITMVSIRLGPWWFDNGHLQRLTSTISRDGKNRWQCWRCVFCGRQV